MKTILFVILFSLSSVTAADAVKKWVDESGKIHYGNTNDAAYVDSAETLKINDTFDRESYDAGLVRHKENEQVGDQYERERVAEEKERQKIEEIKNKLDKNRAAKAPPSGGTAVRSYPTPAKPAK